MSEALQLPGVVDVITAEDIPGMKVRPMFGYHEELLASSEVDIKFMFTRRLYLGQRSSDSVPSVRVQVSCVGQMVCGVVADTRVHAKRGAAAVKISYKDLPDPIFTVEVSGVCFTCWK